MKKWKLRERVAELEDRVAVLESAVQDTVTARIHTLNGKVLIKTIPFKGYELNHEFSFPSLTHPSFVIEEITWELNDKFGKQHGSWGKTGRGWYCDRSEDFTVAGAKWVLY